MRMMNKLRSRGGETLIETLAAIVIIVLSVSFFAFSATAAARMNRTASLAAESLRDSVAAAELRRDYAGEAALTVTFAAGGSKNITVSLYGADGVCSYAHR